MADITDTINSNKQAREIDFILVVDNERFSIQNTVSVLYGSKSEIYIAHVPV